MKGLLVIGCGKDGVGKVCHANSLSSAFAQPSFGRLLIDADVGHANADVHCCLGDKRLDRRTVDAIDDRASLLQHDRNCPAVRNVHGIAETLIDKVPPR